METKKTVTKRTGFLLWQAANLWQREQNKALKDIGLTHVQFMLLYHIFHLEKKLIDVSQSQLAEIANADTMMTSQVVRSLEKKGLVFRQKSAHDSRALELQTTNKGRIVILQALKVVDAIDHLIFDKIADVSAFTNSLEDFLK